MWQTQHLDPHICLSVVVNSLNVPSKCIRLCNILCSTFSVCLVKMSSSLAVLHICFGLVRFNIAWSTQNAVAGLS